MPNKSELILSPDNTVLVVVDIQEKLYAAIEGRRELALQAVKTIKLAQLFKLPIIATEQYPQGLGVTIPRIKEALGDVKCHEKLHFSAFDVEEFVRELEGTGRKDILIVGIEAHICILQTALDALVNGYGVHIMTDAVGSRDMVSKDLGVKKIEHAGGILSNVELAAYELMRQAKTQEFNEVIGFLFD